MSFRLAHCLVEQNLVSVSVMDRACRRQLWMGGSLDTQLLEMGVIAPSVLQAALEELDGEGALQEDWLSVSWEDSGAQQLPSAMVVRYQLLPLVQEEESLRVLRMDVGPPLASLPLSYWLGQSCVGHTILQYRWFGLAQQRYGIAVPARMQQLLKRYPLPASWEAFAVETTSSLVATSLPVWPEPPSSVALSTGRTPPAKRADSVRREGAMVQAHTEAEPTEAESTADLVIEPEAMQDHPTVEVNALRASGLDSGLDEAISGVEAAREVSVTDSPATGIALSGGSPEGPSKSVSEPEAKVLSLPSVERLRNAFLHRGEEAESDAELEAVEDVPDIALDDPPVKGFASLSTAPANRQTLPQFSPLEQKVLEKASLSKSLVSDLGAAVEDVFQEMEEPSVTPQGPADLPAKSASTVTPEIIISNNEVPGMATLNDAPGLVAKFAQVSKESMGAGSVPNVSGSLSFPDPPAHMIATLGDGATTPLSLTKRAGSEESMKMLISQFLAEADATKRAALAEEMATIGTQIVPLLVQELPAVEVLDETNPQSMIRLQRMAQAGRALGEPGTQRLLQVLLKGSQEDRMRALLLLAQWPSNRAVASLFQMLLTERDAVIHRMSRRVLLSYRQREEFETLLQFLRENLHSSDKKRQQKTLDLLQELRIVEVVADVLPLLGSASATISESALKVLRRLLLQDFGRDIGRWEQWWAQNKHRARKLWIIDGMIHPRLKLRKLVKEELGEEFGDDFGYDPQASSAEREAVQNLASFWVQQE